MKVNVIYRDNSIVVCEKPKGVLSEASDGVASMPTLLASDLSVSRVDSVHRLDRDVSGLMVYSLDRRASAALSADIAEGRMTKEYLAVVSGVPSLPEGELCDLLFYDRKRGKSFVVDKKRAGVREARLAYTLLSEANGLSLLKIRLFTGRTHQIRVQFASRGLPLLGDRRYGGPTSPEGIALMSHRLAFRHPEDARSLDFTLPPPDSYPWNGFSLEV